MANREISALPVADALGTDDLFLVQQSGAAKQVTTQQMRQEFGGGGGGGGGGSAGAYQFSIVDGDLICTYEGLTPPNYEVNDDGDLILTVAEGQTINCGRVQGRNGKAGTVIEAITATVDSTTGTPSCTVTAGGTTTARTYALAFSGLKGADGTMTFEELTDEQKASLKGEGIEDIEVTVDGTSSATPSCAVSKSGDGTDKTYTLAFSGLKGAPGKDGVDGVDNLPTVSTLAGATVSLAMAHNVEYRCSDAVTSLTIEGFTAATDTRASMWAIQFTAGSSIAVTVPSSVKWAVASPVWMAGVTYWLSFVPLITGDILGVWVTDE